MFKEWLNFSSSFLLREIDRFFELYPEHPYHHIFAVPHLRQALAAYVANKVFDASEGIDDFKQRSPIPESFSRSFEQHLQIENWIHAGMMQVLQENIDWVAQMIEQEFLSINYVQGRKETNIRAGLEWCEYN